ncbi:receptor-binding cancer antigen expressed on SiSo cells [Anabrus simplex]|uniref:receptor-binding cancer antigen expressed on SiSo cells n=1 Tax=Anabrus simplex TaxID=316456 RepID=UPI0034DD5515
MAVTFIFDRVRALMFLLLGVVKRALCCFRRRRRNSCDPIPLTAVGVVPNKETDTSMLNERSVPELQNWNSWDDTPSSVVTEHSQRKSSVQEQIELYRQKAKYSESQDENQPDFFEDMTPKITKQTKILLKNENDPPSWNESLSPRLTLAVDSVSFTSPDLETWEETPGWEDQTQEDWDPDTVLREKRRQERMKRYAEQQKKKMEREQIKQGRPVAPLGSRIR